MLRLILLLGLVVSNGLLAIAVDPQDYTWKNVKIGGGGGFVPGIVFNPTEQGVAYARTDVGGAYRLNDDDSWTPLLDWAIGVQANYWGVDALATDPVEPNRLYLATGLYTIDWDPLPGHILISDDYGDSFTEVELPFKVGGNMPGRGMGERLAIDPNDNSILLFGARSGNGLWKSTDKGQTWAQVESLPDTGTFIPDPSDTQGNNNDRIGVAWVTFDPSSGSAGEATPRIFVGVASNGTDNIFVSEDAGSTWTALPGQQQRFFPHKGVLSEAENVLYVTYSDGAGPYDGTNGAVHKYDIAASTWTDITPVSGSDLYFGFGGFAIDVLNPGTIMVAALNSWWPDGQIFRSTDSGVTWKPIWAFTTYPEIQKQYTYDISLAPWLGPAPTTLSGEGLQTGWMMEGLVIDPHDSNHWLYGTGETVFGGHDLTKWDNDGNITLKSLADGIEETVVLGIISPPEGPHLLSAVGDNCGFAHLGLDTVPESRFTNPQWSTSSDIDFAGNAPTNIVRIGTDSSGETKQVALSTDSGATWSEHPGAPDRTQGGKVALSADGDTVLWSTADRSGVLVSKNQATFESVSSLPASAIIASDKLNNTVFYGASGGSFYLSTDGGSTFTEASGSLGNSQTPVEIAVNPGKTGDIWVSTNAGIFHSMDSGKRFTALQGVSQAWSIALGAPSTEGVFPALYAVAELADDGLGYYRSDNEGATWVKINDEQHGFGAASGNIITADPRIYGRVYVVGAGRGVFYGDIAA
ncbi:glycoside hydrolase family 74 protein [Moniliophthora roreri MCA 2997]|nr:glycoside hydrolase family 74 protein [Moniliophthora roreri MCA 2997]